MRVAIPPRELAARIIATAVARGGRVAGLCVLLLTVFMVIDLQFSRARAGTLWLPLAMLLVIIACLTFVLVRPGRLSGTLYIGLGSVATFVYNYVLLAADPALHDSAVYLLNRPTFVLVLIGGVSSGYLSAVIWTTAGFVFGTASAVLAQLGLGMTVSIGWGPALVFVICIVIVCTLEGVRRRQHKRVPDLDALEAETARLESERVGENRVAALIHDTALSDLAAVISATDDLDERTRERLRRDAATLLSSLRDGADAGAGTQDRAHAELYNELLGAVSDFQWRGLSVEVSGETTEIVNLSARTREAVIAATRTALDNVMQHSGTMAAEIVFERTESSFDIMVVDDGRGFDPSQVAADRLGIRSSIEERVGGVGGRVRVWSSPGAGTSVYISVPLETSGPLETREARDAV